LDYGSYNWSNNKKLEENSRKFGPFAFNVKLRKEIQRNLGACLSPYNAYLQSIGLETLALRFEKATANSLEIAVFLQNHPKIVHVNYPGLSTSAYYETGKAQFSNLPGAVLTFNFRNKEECFEFMNRLTIIRRATNIYDNKTLIIHPASTIFCDFAKETRENIGVQDTLIRLSPGIEDIGDLINDIQQALTTN
jgi:O-acetylhomoserine (thiol)-lyase